MHAYSIENVWDILDLKMVTAEKNENQIFLDITILESPVILMQNYIS